ncbi:metallophosphoesterase [Burkholderia vietnamiensis]|uniref:Metallophosphoesterase n=1 Tax=Burkholderia vietnamiensis TaxID=60552 RepID=A0AAW7TAA3_BURVI|nr:metallophosphoesterase [Burkholderia vietnamiensis]MBH9645772.1 metallophosphoesterase [Burkholderia vietnamiensis]MBR8008221.1 metallophosphoesterase [Burkholderia vietnamiensis]MDN7551227.1 metallophosphoesterase [Burkholderia vietnamiensis]MDN7798534.1 metallophosphoesterase [Burkholderia vietnamiensis]MDN8044647.1 metallophosphoesterase [Burkholderia vietnamiensis]
MSDIHFGQEKDGGLVFTNDDAKKRLLDDAAGEVAKLGTSASGVIVTGDIAYSAKYEEYVKAGEWLDRLAERVGCSRLDIQMVPGNHDIDRAAITPVVKFHLDSIREHGDKVLDMLLDDEGQREALYERFAAYRDFSSGYGCDLDVGGVYSADVAVTIAPGRTVRFVRLNSALICSRKDDKGTLILGARQRVFDAIDGEEMVVLVHHPLNWLQDSNEAARYFKSRARVIISGHEHFPSLDIQPVEERCDLLMLAAGATAPDDVDEKYTYKYNILRFDWDEAADALAVTINPRTWNPEMKRFERDATFLEGRSERNVLGSPYFRRGAPPVAPMQSRIDGPALMQPVANPVTGSKEADLSMSDDVRLIRLRFFRDLTEEYRRRILVELEAIPADLTDRLDHTIEQRFFTKLVAQGRLDKLSAAIEAAILEKKQGNSE